MRNTKLIVDINKFKENISKIKAYCPSKEIMPVIKANAYGTYINKRIDILNNFNIVAVAIIDEAISLRKNNYQKEIFVLNQPSMEEIEEIDKYNLIVGISSEEFIDKCIEKKIKLRCHLEIETGMNRTGIKLDELDRLLKKIKSNFIIEGAYTHFSSADIDDAYTKKQIDKFKQALQIIKNNDVELKYIHTSASNGLINYKLDFTNIVRPGIIMYGYESFKGAKKYIDVEPICVLKTNITYLKDCLENEKIGYSQKYTCTKKTKVATIPIGYADGLRRSLINKGYVIVNNKKCPIIGNICMDSCMIDVTNVEKVEVNDEVYIFDNNLITLEEIATTYDTINYEVLCTISERVPRIFKEDNNE